MAYYPHPPRKTKTPAPLGLRPPIASLLGELVIDGAHQVEVERRLSLQCATRDEYQSALRRWQDYQRCGGITI